MFTNRDFIEYADRYERIFRNIYPARGNTGFSERNLTANFCVAHDREAIAFYEMQFGIKNNSHIDAILLSQNPHATKKTIACIESKRYKNSNALYEVGEDIGRIYRFLYEVEEESRDPQKRRIDMSIVGERIGCILADVWTENEFKELVLQSYEKEAFLDEFKEEIISGIKNSIRNYNAKAANLLAQAIFDEVKAGIIYDVRGGGMTSNWPKNYWLVSFFWVLRAPFDMIEYFSNSSQWEEHHEY